MRLTEGQQKFLLEARREYLREVSRLLQARQGLQATLKAMLQFFEDFLNASCSVYLSESNSHSAQKYPQIIVSEIPCVIYAMYCGLLHLLGGRDC